MYVHDAAFLGALAFLLGIVFAGLGAPFVAALCLSIVFSFTAAIAIRARKGIVFILVVPIFCAGFAYALLYQSLTREKIVLDREISFSGMLRDEPRGQLLNRFTISLITPYRGEVLVFAKLTGDFHYGDLITLSGRISHFPEGGLVSFSPRVVSIEHQNGYYLKRLLFSLKNIFLDKLDEVLPQEDSALAAGLTVGERSGFSSQFKEAMVRSGTTHIVALSGYNIAILAQGLSLGLGFFMARRAAFYWMIGVIVLFVIMTGAESSVVRAAIMGAMVLIAERMSRVFSFRNAIVIAAALMAIANPTVLLSDVGFELSFGALIGIVYVAPAVGRFLGMADRGGLLSWRENLLATLSAQLGVLPILFVRFGGVSAASLPANVLILWAVPMGMGFAFLAGMLGFVSYYGALAVSWLARPVLHYQIMVISTFARIAEPVHFEFPPFLMLAYYAALASFVIFMNGKPAHAVV